jgi:ATP-dependent Clp protease ATP-binding subunit ClpA
VFERFVEEAVRSILAARDEARRLGHGAVGIEHLVVGILQNDHKAEAIFASKGRTLDDLRSAISRRPDLGTGTSPDDLPFSGEAQKAISLCWSIAEEFRHNTIQPLHMLHALARVDDSHGSGAFQAMGVNLAELLDATREALVPSRKAPTERTSYQEEELEIATPYGPIVLSVVRLPNRAIDDARIISIASYGLNGPPEVSSFLEAFDRLVDASSSGISVGFFRDLFLGMGSRLNDFLQAAKATQEAAQTP